MKFEDVKVGQRVHFTGSAGCVVGRVGVCMYKASDGWIAVEFDISHLDLHTCNGHCKEGHGYWCKPAFLDPVGEDEVVDNSIPDVYIASLEDIVETFFTIGVSRQDMLELFNDISKKYFSEKQL